MLLFLLIYFLYLQNIFVVNLNLVWKHLKFIFQDCMASFIG